MARCVITIEDTADGGLKITSTFNPPIDMRTGAYLLTPAQTAGHKLMEAIDDAQDE